jgi:mono/diheme cytochrome c family protein
LDDAEIVEYGMTFHRLMLSAVFLGLLLRAPAGAFEKPDDLPPGDGREEAFSWCSACHSFNLVSRQGMSRSLWDNTLDLMVEKHGMVEPTGDERALLLDYLSSAYPPGKRRGWQNPFLNK